MEADLARFYSLDIAGFWTGRLSVRRLKVLIAHLPRDAATVRAVAGEAAEWSLTDHLLAAAVDQLAYANHLTGAVNTPPGRSNPIPRPTPMPRPGATAGMAPSPVARGPADVAAVLGAARGSV